MSLACLNDHQNDDDTREKLDGSILVQDGRPLTSVSFDINKPLHDSDNWEQEMDHRDHTMINKIGRKHDISTADHDHGGVDVDHDHT